MQPSAGDDGEASRPVVMSVIPNPPTILTSYYYFYYYYYDSYLRNSTVFYRRLQTFGPILVSSTYYDIDILQQLEPGQGRATSVPNMSFARAYGTNRREKRLRINCSVRFTR